MSHEFRQDSPFGFALELCDGFLHTLSLAFHFFSQLGPACPLSFYVLLELANLQPQKN